MKVNEKLIKHLLESEESGWLDFKQEMYKVLDRKAKEYEWQKNELVRDILSLTNGNNQSVGKTAYLIIGAADQRNPDGSRQLFDVDSFDLSKTQLINWLKAYADPPIEEIDAYFFTYQNHQLFIVEIPPSPYVHKIKRPLQTGHNTKYHENTTFLRLGETITTADVQQIHMLQQAKQAYLSRTKYISPIIIGALFLSIGFMMFDWIVLLQGVPSGQVIIQNLGDPTANVFFQVLFGIFGAIIGAALGYLLENLVDIWQFLSRKVLRIKR